MTLYLGLDLGGTRIRAVAAEPADGVPRILGRDERETPTAGPDEIVGALADAARAALESASAAVSDVAAASCAAPGPLDHRSGVVHEAPNLAGMTEYPLGASLSRALDGLTIFVDHDTKLAAIGEALAGAAVGVADLVYVTVSTGVGGAIVSGGRLLRGATGTAGEIGHWPVALEGPRCGCGSFGCVESLAGGASLERQYGVDDAALVYTAAERGDELARDLVSRAEAALAALGIGLVNVLAPSLILVGGSIAEHQPRHVLEPMRRGIAERAFRTPAAAVRVMPPALGADVGLIGAILAARERAAGRASWFL